MSNYTPNRSAMLEAYRFHVRTIDNARYANSGREPMTDEEIRAEFDRFILAVRKEVLTELAERFDRAGDIADAADYKAWEFDAAEEVREFRDK